MYKMKYRTADNEVLAWGPFPDLRAGAGEAVEDTASDSIRPGMIRITKGEARPKNQAEKDVDAQKEQAARDALKQKLQAAKIDRATLEAIKALRPEDL